MEFELPHAALQLSSWPLPRWASAHCIACSSRLATVPTAPETTPNLIELTIAHYAELPVDPRSVCAACRLPPALSCAACHAHNSVVRFMTGTDHSSPLVASKRPHTPESSSCELTSFQSSVIGPAYTVCKASRQSVRAGVMSSRRPQKGHRWCTTTPSRDATTTPEQSFQA